MERSDQRRFPRRRLWVSLIATALLIIYGVPAFVGAIFPLGGDFGWTLRSDGFIAAVEPDSPAARAGLRAGDRILFGKMPFGTAHRLQAFGQRAGYSATILVQSARGLRKVTLTAAHRAPHTITATVQTILLSAQGLLFLVIGTFVALRRPDAMGLSFFAFSTTAAPSGGLTILFAPIADPAGSVLYGITLFWLASSMVAVTFMAFAFYFPDSRVTPMKRRFVPLVLLVGAISVAEAVYQTIQALQGVLDPTWWSFLLDNCALPVALALLVAEYLDSNAATRTRLFWVFVAFFWGTIVIAAGPLYPLIPDAYAWILSTNIIVPVVLAYAILRHHVFDITFTVNRAIVYAIMTAALALIIALLDWAMERFIGSRNFALAVEALAAVAFGIGFHKVRRVLEAFIERSLFRERHAAEHTVRRIVASLAFADSYEAIAAANVDEVGRAMKLASAVLFLRQENGVYRRLHSYGWQKTHRDMLTTGDSILRVMQTELAPIRIAELPWNCEGPEGYAAPSIAIPLVARNELLGLLLYGMHGNGLSIDPSEVELLAQVGRASASALDNVDARATRRELERARRQLAALGASQPLLSELPSER